MEVESTKTDKWREVDDLLPMVALIREKKGAAIIIEKRNDEREV